jgi:cell division FtsZ-interacting protein ZapD
MSIQERDYYNFPYEDNNNGGQNSKNKKNISEIKKRSKLTQDYLNELERQRQRKRNLEVNGIKDFESKKLINDENIIKNLNFKSTKNLSSTELKDYIKWKKQQLAQIRNDNKEKNTKKFKSEKETDFVGYIVLSLILIIVALYIYKSFLI